MRMRLIFSKLSPHFSDLLLEIKYRIEHWTVINQNVRLVTIYSYSHTQTDRNSTQAYFTLSSAYVSALADYFWKFYNVRRLCAYITKSL